MPRLAVPPSRRLARRSGTPRRVIRRRPWRPAGGDNRLGSRFRGPTCRPRRRDGPVVPGPVRPPIAPMLARLVRELPSGALSYEPKWDGFRCIAFVERDAVDLRSRHDRPLARYFPEIVAGFEGVVARRTSSASRSAGDGDASDASFVVDG